MLTSTRIRFFAAVAAVLVSACGSDDDKQAAPVLGSQLNEACRSTADCAGGLACVPPTNATGVSTCQPVENNVIPNAKECVAIECEAPADCCDTQFSEYSMCSSWQSYCDSGSTTYPSACELTASYLCVCSAQSFKCERNNCVPIRCNATSDCCKINNFTRPTTCDSYAANCRCVASLS